MKIKPLEWVENNWSETAETPFGHYRIFDQGYGHSCSFQFNGKAHETILNKLNATSKSAKQAAENHWQERVKRCLTD